MKDQKTFPYLERFFLLDEEGEGQMLKIGLLGFGTVNSGVYEGLTETKDYLEELLNQQISIEKVLVRNIASYLGKGKDELFTNSPDEFFQHEFHVVFEAMGGEQPALDYLTFLLTKKIAIITANKELLAKHGPLLESIATRNDTFLGFEAAVAGGIPIINTLRSQLHWSSIDKVSGILNGTTNFIITKLQEGNRTFSSVLQEAQELGFAEADPTADVEGFDALYKLQILSRLCFGLWPNSDQFQRKGMSQLQSWHFKAGEYFHLKLKYIAEAYFDGKEVKGIVSPCFVEEKHPLAAINDENNGVFIQGEWLGNFITSGPGAGKKPTATSMIEDFLHHIQRKGGKFSFIKRKKGNAPVAKQFLLLFDSRHEREIYQALQQVQYCIEETVLVENENKVAMLVTVHDSLSIPQDNAQLFPILRLNENPQVTSREKQLKAL